MIYMIHKEKQRYYWLSIQQDIFEEWCVVKVFGGINNKHVRELWEPCNSQLEASQRMFDIEKIRLKRGYVYADTKASEDFMLTSEVV
jgi:predicted DNA-binding WGR domain protein